MIDTSKIYKSKSSGDFKITKELAGRKVEVTFLATGFCRLVRKDHALNGEVKDPLSPTVCGVGFRGVGNHRVTLKGRRSKAYSAWKGMLERCYGENLRGEYPTYKGCSVCKDWHNFQNFAEWFERNYIDGYQLDKDIKIDGNKVYSPSTCLFVSREENIIAAAAKTHRLVSPCGDITEIYNLAEFCRVTGLSRPSVCAVSKGRIKSHKGWTKAPA